MDYCFGIQALAILQCHHIEMNGFVEQPPVISTRFHHQCKTGQLGSTVVNVQPVEVFFQNQARYGTGLVATLQINGFKNVISYHQNVTTSTGRVQHGDGFGVQRGQGGQRGQVGSGVF